MTSMGLRAVQLLNSAPVSHKGLSRQAAVYTVRQGVKLDRGHALPLTYKVEGFTGNGLQLSQLTKTGIRSEYASNSFDNLNQQCGSSHPQLSQVPATIYCLELTETDYISQDSGQ